MSEARSDLFQLSILRAHYTSTLVLIGWRTAFGPRRLREFLHRHAHQSCKHRYSIPCESRHAWKLRLACSSVLVGLILAVCFVRLLGSLSVVIPLMLAPVAWLWFQVFGPYLEARAAWQSHRRDLTSRRPGEAAIVAYLDQCSVCIQESLERITKTLRDVFAPRDTQPLEVWWRAFFHDAETIVRRLRVSRVRLEEIEHEIHLLHRKEAIMSSLFNTSLVSPASADAGTHSFQIETAPSYSPPPAPSKKQRDHVQDLQSEMFGTIKSACQALHDGLFLIRSHLKK